MLGGTAVHQRSTAEAAGSSKWRCWLAANQEYLFYHQVSLQLERYSSPPLRRKVSSDTLGTCFVLSPQIPLDTRLVALARSWHARCDDTRRCVQTRLLSWQWWIQAASFSSSKRNGLFWMYQSRKLLESFNVLQSRKKLKELWALIKP